MFTREDKENIPTPTRHIEETLETIQITPELVCKKLKRLNPEKSPGHDNWHPYFLQQIIKRGAHKSWLKAIITAIFKKGVRSDPGNYRPVSLT